MKQQKQSKDVELLKNYLERYYRAVRRRKQLEDRLQRICREMESPIGGINYRPVNFGGGGVGPGSAVFTLRKSEIETRIQEQKRKTEEDLLKVMDILDYLEPQSDERMILELRYIDNLAWDKIPGKACMSRSACFEWHNRGIAKLLEYKRVRKVIQDYAKSKRPGC